MMVSMTEKQPLVIMSIYNSFGYVSGWCTFVTQYINSSLYDLFEQ